MNCRSCTITHPCWREVSGHKIERFFSESRLSREECFSPLLCRRDRLVVAGGGSYEGRMASSDDTDLLIPMTQGVQLQAQGHNVLAALFDASYDAAKGVNEHASHLRPRQTTQAALLEKF